MASTAEAKLINWANPEIRLVLRQGYLPDVTRATFRPKRDLDAGTLYLLLDGALAGGGSRVQLATGAVTVSQLDEAFVRALGLGAVADAATAHLRSIGYPARDDAGLEIAARAMRLRENHGTAKDRLERGRDEKASRAQAAYSTAQVIRGVDIDKARAILERVAQLQPVAGARGEAIGRAIQMLGEPYVWGGEWETGAAGASDQDHGGFDCSGLVWRALALGSDSPGRMIRAIGGRSTFEIAATTPKDRRLGREGVRPGDMLLFGPGGVRAASDDIGHMGIDIGSGLVIHSSNPGVQISFWDAGWYQQRFAFAKSVLD